MQSYRYARFFILTARCRVLDNCPIFDQMSGKLAPPRSLTSTDLASRTYAGSLGQAAFGLIWRGLGRRRVVSLKLGASYSQPLVDLVYSRRITLDYVQVPPSLSGGELEWLRSYVPVVVHGLPGEPSLCKPNIAEELFPSVHSMIRETETPWVSHYIGYSCELVDVEVHAVARTDPLTRDEILTNICDNAVALKQKLSVPLLLENLPYHEGGAHVHVCEPSFITEVIERTECGFIFDISHAIVSAKNLDIPLPDYLSALPLERATEIHISGPRMAMGKFIDAHAAPSKLEFEVLSDTLAKSSPDALTIEFEGPGLQIVRQLSKVSEAVGTGHEVSEKKVFSWRVRR